jgi:transcriptional regulator with XRE-family HTH domain
MTAANIKETRAALGWPASLLGDLAGYSISTIYEIESGRHLAPPRTLAALGLMLKRGNDPGAWGGLDAAPPALLRHWRRRGIA